VPLAASVHVLSGSEKLPVESDEKPTVPVGVLTGWVPVSVTIAVQIVAVPTCTEVGEHDIEVEVDRSV
jgi:hypothetical protein